MLKKLRKEQKGFTIIEVLIVLAIAGLILLIVFLAVPALQRNQRNAGRRAEASRILTAADNWVSNQNGTLPTAGSAGVAGQILRDAGSLSQYSTIAGGTAAVMTAGQFNIVNAAVTSKTNVTADALLLSENAVCDNNNPGQTTATGAIAGKSMALIYSLEPASGNYTQACLSQ